MKESDIHNINAIRVLCAELVQKAESGHPGAPMGLSDFAYFLFTQYLTTNDIFVLSNGHACVLQYVMNFLCGRISMEDLLSFRKLNSITPGHPEKDFKHGIFATTGPLGQGMANALGLAVRAKLLNTKERIVCIFGDGCYQEGIGQETLSLLPVLHKQFCLYNLLYVYDYNQTTIDGSTELSMAEDAILRIKSLGIEVEEIEENKNYHESIKNALLKKRNMPGIIILHTTIGKDSKLAGSSNSHGSPLGNNEITSLKKKYNISGEFYLPNGIKDKFSHFKINKVEESHKLMHSRIEITDLKDQATREHFHDALNIINVSNAQIVSSCADLLASVKCKKNNSTYIHFGIREHAMMAVMSAMGSMNGILPVCGTFLNFVSYGFPALRLAAFSQNKLIVALSHDSIALGEDGPTHQPIEMLPLLRATPGLVVCRPCDGTETYLALNYCINNVKGPSCHILTRQKVAELSLKNRNYFERGAYIVHECNNPKAIIIATGSEVNLACEAASQLECVRVISMWSCEIFDQQDSEYKNQLIPKAIPSISLEAASTFGWSKYAKYQIGINEYGRSGSGDKVMEFFGFTIECVKKKIQDFLKLNL